MSDNIEIEKKFKVINDSWRDLVYDKKTIYQGYYLDEDKTPKRIRIVKEDAQAIVAYKEDKGIVNGFLERIEIENEIDYQDGLLKLIRCPKVLIKERNFIKHQEFILEVDEFLNLNKPLVLVEVELKREQLDKKIEFPEWFGKDLTLSKAYRNFSLVKKSQDSDVYLKELFNKKKLKP